MKLKYVAPIAALALFSSAVTVEQARSSIATDLGTSVAESIVGAIAGKGAEEVMGLIFGSQQDMVTLDQIKDAINGAFAEAELKDLQGEFNGVENQIEDYRPDSSTALTDAGNIVTATGNLQGNIESHITKDNSIKTIPLHVSMTNSRLAFAAERYRLETIPDNREAITKAALSGLHSLQHYLERQMSDPKRNDWPCVKKDADTVLNINGADGSNWTEKAVNVSTQYCYGNGRVVKEALVQALRARGLSGSQLGSAAATMAISDAALVNLGGSHFMRTTDLGRTSNSGIYLFARRMDNRGAEYFLEASKSKQFAEMLRHHYFLKHYPRELGDLHAQVLAWVDIVQATGTDNDLLEALNVAINLGMGWNTLKDRYNHQATTNFIHQNLVPFFAHQGESRAILD